MNDLGQVDVQVEVRRAPGDDLPLVELRVDVADVAAHEIPAEDEGDREGLAHDERDREGDAWMVTVVVTVPKMVMSARLAPTRRGPAYGVRRRRSSGVSVSAQRTQLGAAVSQSAEMGALLSVTVWRMWVAGLHVAWRTAMTARVAGVACSTVQHGHCMVWLRTMQSKQRTRGGLVAPGSGRRWITSRATLVQRRPLVAPGH